MANGVEHLVSQVLYQKPHNRRSSTRQDASPEPSGERTPVANQWRKFAMAVIAPAHDACTMTGYTTVWIIPAAIQRYGGNVMTCSSGADAAAIGRRVVARGAPPVVI